MANWGTFNIDFPAGFTWVVDSAIRSSSSSSSEGADLEISPVHSFASVVDNAIMSDSPEVMSDAMGSDVEDGFQLFTQAQLVAATTNNFSLENKIGAGSFGAVYRGDESFFSNTIDENFRDFSWSNHTDDRSQIYVTVNGKPISDRVIKKAEKLAGPIKPGNYWYDFRGGFWGVKGGPCLGIILPFIEEFNHPLPDKCSGGNTGVFVNGRELHQKDLGLLARRGLPTDRDRSYIIEISGRVLDEDTGEELDSLGKLAPTVEKKKCGFGMKIPRAATQSKCRKKYSATGWRRRILFHPSDSETLSGT